MFFNTENISFEILSVLTLNWGERNDKSDLRRHHALSYRTKGNAEFIHKEGVETVKTGDIMLVPSFCEYMLKTGEEKLIVIHFMSDSDLPTGIRKFSSERAEYFENKFSELYNVWTKKQIGYEHECKSILYKIITKIEREISEIKIKNGQDKIKEALDYIHDNFTDHSLTVEYLAKMCGMSDTYFRKLFVEKFSVTPVCYINNMRVNYAKELLQSGYYTVAETAEKCGFNTMSYFSTFMKKHTGEFPSKFLYKN